MRCGQIWSAYALWKPHFTLLKCEVPWCHKNTLTQQYTRCCSRSWSQDHPLDSRSPKFQQCIGLYHPGQPIDQSNVITDFLELFGPLAERNFARNNSVCMDSFGNLTLFETMLTQFPVQCSGFWQTITTTNDKSFVHLLETKLLPTNFKLPSGSEVAVK